MARRTKAAEVFYCYAHEDEELRNELEKHLSSLQRQKLITTWHDRRIIPGTEWAGIIDMHLNTASIILLLISPDFLASDYCYDVEMKRALERHRLGEARVIPIMLRPVDWKGTPFERLLALPTDARPVTTWSNQDEAFLDVTRGIRVVIEDLNLPTVSRSTTPSSLWNIPYRRNPFFTGQETTLTYLYDTLARDKTAALTQPYAISGLGGIGKTQIAIEYAYRHREIYHAVLWARADSRESLIIDIVAIARLLGLPEKGARDQSIAIEVVKNWLGTHDHWLLILDNVDDVTLIRDFIPFEVRGHILLTTRAQALGTIARGIRVDQMRLEEGVLLLLRRAKVLALEALLDQAPEADRVAAEDIVKALGGLPLALDQAGAYIEETGCSVAVYMEIRYHHLGSLF